MAELLAPLHVIATDSAELAKCTPAELWSFFNGVANLEGGGWFVREGTPKRIWAAVDLDRYVSIEEFVAQCRKVHKGNAIRDAAKASKLGYYSKFFDERSYVPDMAAIDMSMPIRGGRPMTPLYRRTIEERGGYPNEIEGERFPRQAAMWVRFFGLFRPLPGHHQGDVVSDEQLVAYIRLSRYSNFTYYVGLIGHAEHLADGIMYRMHLDLIRVLLHAREAATESEPSLASLNGIRYVGYTEFYGIRPGLHQWKKRMLFEPIAFQLDYLAPDLIDHLCAATEHALGNPAWQSRCAQMLAEMARRCQEEGRYAEAARAQTQLAAVSRRLGVTGSPAG